MLRQRRHIHVRIRPPTTTIDLDIDATTYRKTGNHATANAGDVTYADVGGNNTIHSNRIYINHNDTKTTTRTTTPTNRNDDTSTDSFNKSTADIAAYIL